MIVVGLVMVVLEYSFFPKVVSGGLGIEAMGL